MVIEDLIGPHVAGQGEGIVDQEIPEDLLVRVLLLLLGILPLVTGLSFDSYVLR